MKRKYAVFFLLIGSVVVIGSCTSLIECSSVAQRQATFLMDVSDKKLFTDIENDLNTNFPGFMQKSGLGNISPCQSFTLSFAHLSGKEELDISSAVISINRKGQSKKEEGKQASPEPLVQLMQTKMAEYRKLTDDPKMTAGSNIANVLIKAIIQANPEAENYFFLFSDLVENNRQLNLYKDVPDKKDVPQIISKMIEPSVLEKFRQLQKNGLQPKIIVVMKQEPSGKTDQRAIKDFWIAVFKELKLQVQFVDNLSNTVEL